MSMKSFRSKIKGFTLVELLVVIAIIALLVAIVFPAISNALLRGRVTATSVNARNMHQAIVAKSVSDIYFSAASPFPADNFADSTAYMRYLVTNQILNVSFSFFAPPGVVSAQSEQEFQAANNGWCVVDESENIPETAPFIFTRNLGGDGAAAYNTLTPVTAMGNAFRGAPFIDRGFAFVTRGGAAFALIGEDLTDADRFNSLFVTQSAIGNTNLNNTVLRP